MLTKREVEVLHGVALGLSNEEIGQRLWLTCNTIRKHLYRIGCKLGMGDRAGLVALAFRHGWLYWEDSELIMSVPMTKPPTRKKGQAKTYDEWWAKTLDRLAERHARLKDVAFTEEP